jgi:hypothetical protein
MPNNTAAFWSAIAASFAALSSFLIYRMQLRNFRFSVRPDIVLENWSRRKDENKNCEIISFTEIENIGSGTAQHIYINSFEKADDDRPTYFMSTVREPVLAKEKKATVNAEISIFWRSVPINKTGSKHLSIKILVLYWDTAGIRHSKPYNLFVVEDTKTHIVTDALAPGIMLGPLVTSSTPVWRLKLNKKLARIPFIGKRYIDRDVV